MGNCEVDPSPESFSQETVDNITEAVENTPNEVRLRSSREVQSAPGADLQCFPGGVSLGKSLMGGQEQECLGGNGNGEAVERPEEEPHLAGENGRCEVEIAVEVEVRTEEDGEGRTEV